MASASVQSNDMSDVSGMVDVLDAFGKHSFTIMQPDEFQFLNFVDFGDMVQEFKRMLKTILDSNYQRINLFQFNSLLFNLVNTNPEAAYSTLYELFDSESEKFYETLQKSISDNTFSLDMFVHNYREFYKRMIRLNGPLHMYEESIKRDSKSNKSNKSNSDLNLMRSYLFYKNVINRKYNYNGEEVYLYGIISKILETQKTTIQTILPLFKMKEFYGRLCYVSNDKNIFNVEMDKDFLVTLGSNQLFVKSLVVYINNKIRELVSKNDTDNVRELEDIITLGINFNERQYFYIYYKKLLENRLLSDTHLQLEGKLVSIFKKVRDKSEMDCKVINEMETKIKDIEASSENREVYMKLKIKIGADSKYKGLNIETFDRSVLHTNVLTFYAWENSKSLKFRDYTVPIDVEPHIDIFLKYYNRRHPNRELRFNFSLGTAVVKLTLGDKLYHFKVSTPQMFMLLQFNDAERISAKQLSERMGIPIKIVGLLLNSFLEKNVMARDPGPGNDPNMMFYLNDDFSYPSDKISIEYYPVLQQLTQEDDQEATEEFATGRDNILKALVVHVVKKDGPVEENAMIDKVKQKLPFEPEQQMVTEAIEKAINEEYIVKKVDDAGDTVYEYHLNVVDELKPTRSRGYSSDQSDSSDDDSDDY